MNNTVELIGTYGDDELIACSAWTSTSRDLTEEKKERIPELLDKLWNDGHETPFEKGVVHFLVNCDVASHIHLLKHRISSLNAESARYKELKEDKYYIPEDLYEVWLTEDLYIFEDEKPFTKGNQSWGHVLEEFSVETNRLYHMAIKDIEKQYGRKRAKESARYFKTYNSQIQSDVSFNMRSFANFLKLRYSDNAQNEIQDIARQMLVLVKQTLKFEHTLKAWGY
ncbi:THY1 Predicted alternative thymidylate synthase [uncultured Caudovirales phage]|uniref:THY1 Predicted alternative thymidylate synthase n=1 Tax=uncultured Caudovirales phage TaxID=2100421 RepID=A0A6J5NJ33_9CAUD|nr:THY1 Predicted alternative thymidylate synthase [uncultured Caudovirales phage]